MKTQHNLSLLFLFTVSCVCFVDHANAQNIATSQLEWIATNVVDQKANTPLVYPCSFKTHASQSIDWIQGSKTYHYTITQTTGTWPSVASNGEVKFDVTAGDYVTGKFIFTKNDNGITIYLKTKSDGQTDLDLMFTVSDVQLQ